jgi:3-oxoacyl-[acyl-carrier protein] reductase
MALKLDLSGKVALVTGGGSQLGRFMSKTLAEAGAAVAVHYFESADRAEKIANDMKAQGYMAMAVQANVDDTDSVQAMQQKIAAELGEVDILVTNAVGQVPWKNVMDYTPEEYIDHFKASVVQNVVMAQVFVPHMKSQRWGRIIGINTECTMQCLPTQSTYVAAKRGMDGLMLILAREIGEAQITVNQVAPGWTISERDPDTGAANELKYAETVALKRRGTAQEIANVVAFLASDLASFITGAFIPVCGGNVMPTV